MNKACCDVRQGRLSIRRAAESYQVPRSTLSDRVTGRVSEGSHSGPSRYLSDEEEAELVHFLVGSASVGYAKTKKDVLAIVSRIIEAKGGAKSTVSHGWWESFRKRHPNLTLRTAEKLSYARYVSTDPDIINQYFDLLKDTLMNNKLLDRPAQIFNCDETGLPLDQTPTYVVAAKGQTHPRSVVTGTKKQITVLACANAAGNVLPPLVIFARKALNPDLTRGEVPGTMYGLTDNGWMDGEVFENWFTHHFLSHAPAVRPLLLLLDGHSTHYNPSFIRKAAQEKVIVFCLPPNTTHMTQPLDKGAFGPLKMAWAEQCHRYMQLNPGKVVTQFEFMALFSKAWCNSMTSTNIISAFRTTGVSPFNRQAVLVPTKQVFNPKSLATSTGLAFIPLYSPHNKRSMARIDSRETSLDRLNYSSDEGDNASFTGDYPMFSEGEEALFKRRLEEGFDLPFDHRYNLWRSAFTSKPGASQTNVSFPEVDAPVSYAPPNLLFNDRPVTLKKFLPPSPPLLAKPHTYSKASAKVLTSSECIQTMEYKERLKREKQEEKERRKQERERKKELKKKATGKNIPGGKKQLKKYQYDMDLICACSITEQSSEAEEQRSATTEQGRGGAGGRGRGRGRGRGQATTRCSAATTNDAHSG